MTNFRLDDALDPWLAENVFYLRAPVSRFGKLLAHYELYKLITGIPGAIVECGVYKGASLTRLAMFRSLCENVSSRPIYGFDAFGEFPKEGVASAADKAFIRAFETEGGQGISKSDLEGALTSKRLDNVTLVAGLVHETIPPFLEANPALRIALLHLDLDVYEPTRACLDLLASRMTKGGLILFDDYTAVEGATRAADEFCAVNGYRLKKLPYYSVPSYVEV